MPTKKVIKKKKTKRVTRKSAARARKSISPSKEKRGLESSEIVLGLEAREVAPLVREVVAAGGAAIGAYREPLSGRSLLLATVPLKSVDPTPFQRDLSPTHSKRLAAKLLGLQQITVLVSPDQDLAFRILALNTEKAHNLKDRSLEVIRMARELAARNPRAKESDFTAEFESPELLTLGIVYEQNGRFAGGAYGPFLKKNRSF